MKSHGLYIHIPFCTKKCKYCAFFSGGINPEIEKLYLEALVKEFSERRRELPQSPDSIYIGGGTPSLLSESSLAILKEKIIDLSSVGSGLKEFTIEVNPDDVNSDKIKFWKEIGVNRLSIGVQSFCDDELSLIGRRHNAKEAIAAYELAKNYFDNISIDLMYGLPRQTLQSFKKTLETATSLNPEHISSYWLSLEDKTPLKVLHDNGRIALPDEETGVRMWRLLNETLYNEGFSHYEISNYAKPGKMALHNMKYWFGNPYLGLGPSAHSYDGGNIRRFNPSDLHGYIKYYLHNDSIEEKRSFYDEEKLSEDEMREEFVFTRLRTKKGLSLIEFEREFGSKEKEKLMKGSLKYIEDGKMEIIGHHLSFTEEGMLTSDNILLDLI